MPAPKVNNIQQLLNNEITNHKTYKNNQIILNLNDDYDDNDGHSTSHSNIPSCHSPSQEQQSDIDSCKDLGRINQINGKSNLIKYDNHKKNNKINHDNNNYLNQDQVCFTLLMPHKNFHNHNNNYHICAA